MTVSRDSLIGAGLGALATACVTAAVLLAAGCGRKEEPKETPKGQTEVRFVVPANPEPRQPTSIDREELRRLDELNRRQDKALSK